jgi:hypothetical protein
MNLRTNENVCAIEQTSIFACLTLVSGWQQTDAAAGEVEAAIEKLTAVHGTIVNRQGILDLKIEPKW